MSVCCMFCRKSSRCGLPPWPHRFDSGAGFGCCFLVGWRGLFCLQEVSTPHTYIWQSFVPREWPDPTGRGRHQQTHRECRSRKPWAHYNFVIPMMPWASETFMIQMDVLKTIFYEVYIQLFNNIATKVSIIECMSLFYVRKLVRYKFI